MSRTACGNAVLHQNPFLQPSLMHDFFIPLYCLPDAVRSKGNVNIF